MLRRPSPALGGDGKGLDRNSLKINHEISSFAFCFRACLSTMFWGQTNQRFFLDPGRGWSKGLPPYPLKSNGFKLGRPSCTPLPFIFLPRPLFRFTTMQVLTPMTLYSNGRSITVYAPSTLSPTPPAGGGFPPSGPPLPPSIGIPNAPAAAAEGWNPGAGPLGSPGTFHLSPLGICLSFRFPMTCITLSRNPSMHFFLCLEKMDYFAGLHGYGISPVFFLNSERFFSLKNGSKCFCFESQPFNLQKSLLIESDLLCRCPQVDK